MATFEDLPSRMQKLINASDQQFRARFVETVVAIRSAQTLDTLAVLIEAGRLEEALIGAEQAALQLGNQWGRSFVGSGNDTAKFIGNTLEVNVNFDVVNDRAVAAMQQNQLRLVRGFVEDQRVATRQAITDGIRRGANPIEQARDFRDTVGLTPNQQKYISNYRRQLENLESGALDRTLRDGRFDSTVRRAIRDKTPLSPGQIDKMVERYQSRWVAHRSKIIARTESLRSVHAGNQEMYRQAVESGTLDATEIQREWADSDDGRVRGTHAGLDGQIRGLTEPFTSPSGASLMYPTDPNAPPEESVACRCAVLTRFTDSAKLRTQQGIDNLVGAFS